MQNQDEEKGREDQHTEGTRRLFQQWFGDQAEEVARAILLDNETYGDAEDDDEAGPALNDDELTRLVADANDRAQRIGDEQDRLPLKSISGGTVDRPMRRRETGSRRLTAYNRGPTNVLRIAVSQVPAPIRQRMHMDAAGGGEDYALDLTSYRDWLDAHGAGWVGPALLLFTLEAGRMVRVTTERDEATVPAADLIVEFVHKDGRYWEVRLTPTDNEAALELEDGDVAEWPCSISLKIERR